jgi:hypothetical protein
MTHFERLAPLTLYKLKRDYGEPLDIYTLRSCTTSILTGEKIVLTNVTRVKRAIALPAQFSRNKLPAIATLCSEYVAGGSHDIGVCQFLVDRKDAPDLQISGSDDWLVYQNRKYQIKDFDLKASFWFITGRELKGEVPQQTVKVSVGHTLNAESQIGSES